MYREHESQHTLRKQASFTLKVAWHLGKLANSPNVDPEYQEIFAEVQPRLLVVSENVIKLANDEGEGQARVEDSKNLMDMIEIVVPALNDPHPDKCKRRFVEPSAPTTPIPKI